MPISEGTHKLGPANGSITIKTYRDGAAKAMGHDLILGLSQWDGTLTVANGGTSVEFSTDASAITVDQGIGGAKALSGKDKTDIIKSMNDKVVSGPITFKSSAVELSDGGMHVRGELSMAGSTAPADGRLRVGDDGQITGALKLSMSSWGIKQFKAMMGALKVKDEIEVEINVRP